MNTSSKFLAAALVAAAAPFLVAPAAAAPIAAPLGLQNAAAPLVETVQYRRSYRGGYRGDYRGGRSGGAGFIAGALLGGAIIGATQPYGYYGYDRGYGYGPGYDDPDDVAVSPYAGGSEIAYCQQRFRSYDPRSGTYLGHDGMRHPCP